MTLTPKRIAVFWLAALIALAGLVFDAWRPILLPLACGMAAAACFVNSLVDWLEARGLNRIFSAGLTIATISLLIQFLSLPLIFIINGLGVNFEGLDRSFDMITVGFIIASCTGGLVR